MKLLYSWPLLVLAVNAWLPSHEDSNAPFTFRRASSRIASRTLLSTSKVRGVNVGSLFVLEPWMASKQWSNMGCDGSNSESDCVQKLGQSTANTVFQRHWATWIKRTDIRAMVSYGLNTVRIPVGYWMREDLVTAGEHFPQGGLKYLKQFCKWATDAGLYIIIDLHGAPGAQQPNQPFTGQNSPNTYFYNNATNYERAYKFYEWIAYQVHTDASFANVGMLELLNEPLQGQQDKTANMISQFYPTAVARIRAAEKSLGVPATKQLHVQVMDSLWGSGSPRSSLGSTANVAFDDHEYIKWNPGLDKTNVTQASYLAFACKDNRGTDGDIPKIVSEWSTSIDDAHQDTPEFAANSANAPYYAKLFTAQQQSYEKQLGWVYWSWKAELGDYRWSYIDAVAAGAIPKNLDSSAKAKVC